MKVTSKFSILTKIGKTIQRVTIVTKISKTMVTSNKLFN